MYGFLRSPRWVGFLLLAVVLVVAFTQLAAWQNRRHDERTAKNAVIEANADAVPTPMDEVLSTDDAVDDSLEWRPVVVEGTWDTASEVLVRNRPRDGQPGYLVVTPLLPASGPALLVERGWVRAGASAGERPDVPAPSAGQVSVVARLRPAEEPKSAGDLPDGQVLRIDPALIGAGLEYDVLAGYGELVSETPSPSQPLLLPEEPTISAGPHLGYAVQWVLFAAVGVGGVVVLVRREAQYQREDAERQAAAETSAGST